ncbi:aminotransferase-like domain-containing protein [Actinomarinicola tropica]|uniref:aminotransferase-like domain-containing protein n=1 Tax=Actinomarinicola tropica TaxID=2789776 RepID=UPI00189A103C|nr:PLP-dependent aminotransferase family protein [Actinomarinicola tropica]
MGGTPLDLPPAGWERGPGPLHRRLADALEALVLRGELPPGTALPTERELARRAAVSRATAAEAYRRLKASGRIDSRQGRGTWVAGTLAPAGRAPAESMGAVLEHPDGSIDLSLAAPEAGARERTAIGAALDHARGAVAGTGYEPAGSTALRAALADRPDEVLVTSGAQQAIGFVVEELVRPGEVVVVEDVTYVGALDAARRAGARLVAVPTGPGGVDVEALREAVVRHRPALVYLNPTHQSPTGSVLSDRDRAQIVDLAARTGTPVIDDRVLADLPFDDEGRPRPLRSFDPGAPIVTIGSLSKVAWAGLRVGWVRAEPALVRRLVPRRVVADLGGDVLAQAVALALLDEVPRLAAARALDLRRQHRHLTAALVQHLPEWEVAPSRGGTAAWVRLPVADARAVADAAAAHGVHVVAGSLLAPHGDMGDRLRLAVTQPPEVLDEAVARLAAAWSDLPGRGS